MIDKQSISKVNLFFDESGKDKDPIKTMGGLLIPDKIYKSTKFLEINNKLKNNEFSLHWTDYNGGNSEKKLYIQIIKLFIKYVDLCQFNVIYYNYPFGINKEKFNNMIYSKLPERVIYGLLRFKGENMNVEADLFIEDANVYKDKIKLHDILKTQLNNNAIYRGEKFKVNNFYYKNKNQEIGVELTDLLLGIVRVIIQNKNNCESKRIRNKNLLVLELLKEKEFNNFLKKIKYFEWNNSKELKRINFEDYINNFLANQNEWIEYIEEM